ncbi:hypothetical protein [Brevundimonas sp.]|uniref:hypothetical protein n=1 Tax=Brevundimonas sp. TaxID=1871086 RepID=UPI002D68033C|nr:hypothetical protein [Brevundimonas sp.]HYD28876.1 hypothetical protein [Brevundimonas sp.]
MSASTARGDLLLRDGDPRPFVLIEFERPATEGGAPGVAVSWGDQIDDDDVEYVIATALATMAGVPVEALIAALEKS